MGKSKPLLGNIPWWKKWLSYLVEIRLEERSSVHNPEITLCLSNGRLQLYTANAIYSYEDLYDNFTRTFEKIDFEKHDFHKVLILGFGLGSIPFMLEKTFGVYANYTGIEIDEEIIDLASNYALPKLTSPCTLITADAHTYVELTGEEFDLVIVDIFLDNVIPSQFESQYFLENVKDLLAEDGLLLYNRLTASPGDKERYNAFFESSFSPIFTKAVSVEVDDNTILLNTPIYLKSNY